jgi:hypothetical protein
LHDTSGEEDCRDGRSAVVWRRGNPQNHPPPVSPLRSV